MNYLNQKSNKELKRKKKKQGYKKNFTEANKRRKKK